MFAPWRSQNPVRKTWVSDYWKIIHLVHSVLCKVAMHGSPWRCIRLSLLLDKPCNVCFLPWVSKMINIDLFRRKSFGCLTIVQKLMGKVKTTTCDTTKGNKHRKKHNQLEWNEIYILLSQHNTWMVSFQKVFISKIAVAGHGTRHIFRLTFSRIISIFAILLS